MRRDVQAGRLEGIDEAHGRFVTRLAGEVVDCCFDIVTGGQSWDDGLSHDPSSCLAGRQRCPGPEGLESFLGDGLALRACAPLIEQRSQRLPVQIPAD